MQKQEYDNDKTSQGVSASRSDSDCESVSKEKGDEILQIDAEKMNMEDQLKSLDNNKLPAGPVKPPSFHDPTTPGASQVDEPAAASGTHTP